MEKKYKLTRNKKVWLGRTLYQIKALKNFGYVKKGVLGGWVESESNLSQEGNCWVYDEAKVYGNARICDNANIFNNASVCGNATIRGRAIVYDNANVYSNAIVYDNAKVYGNAKVYSNAIVYDNAKVYGNAKVYDHAMINGYAEVFDGAHVCGSSKLYNSALVYGNAIIHNTILRDNVRIYDSLYDNYTYIYYNPGMHTNITAFLNKDKEILVATFCFKGTIKEFKKYIKEGYGDSRHSKQYKRFIKYTKNHFKDILEENDNEEQ